MEHKRVQFLSDPQDFLEKEKLYLEVRQREGRIVDDSTLRLLPMVSKSSPYAKEWRWRKRSFLRLKQYLEKKNSGPIRVLDLGCGNGWMANKLAENSQWTVTAIDINKLELEQGARLFGRENLHFVYADMVSGTSLPGQFDVIVLAASIQYFPNLAQLMDVLQNALTENGEIHIIDSHFYRNAMERDAARQRTLAYYKTVGVPEMAAYYHHHLWAEVEQSEGKNLNADIKTRLLQRVRWLAPFPWIRILR